MVKTTPPANNDVINKKTKKVKPSSLEKKDKKKKSKKEPKPKVAGDDGKKHRKQHRFKPGTVANFEIRRYQTGAKAEESLIPKAPVYRIIKDILAGLGDYRIEDKAVKGICGLLQQQTTMLMKEANQMAQHAKRKTINIDDMRAARKVCEIHTGKLEDTTTSSRPDFSSFPDLPRQYKSPGSSSRKATKSDDSNVDDASAKGPEIEIANDLVDENASESS